MIKFKDKTPSIATRHDLFNVKNKSLMILNFTIDIQVSPLFYFIIITIVITIVKNIIKKSSKIHTNFEIFKTL